ncbi:MAG: hypothetical protein BGO32_11035 [Bacteroidetes bacterium 37-13]|nr:MAG: hypothetical protein BGO32_11035 [Bacteroidetes bacterium 37-13]
MIGQEKNLLVEFLTYISKEDKEKLKLYINTSGKVKQVWDYSLNAARNKPLSKITLYDELKISHSHFDKICSELLQKCYNILVPERGLKLLSFLTTNTGWVKHLYAEINRQLKDISTLSQAEIKTFVYSCIEIHFSLAAIDRNEYVFKKIKQKFIELSPKNQQHNNLLLLTFKETTIEINSLLANAQFQGKEDQFYNKLKRLKPNFETTNPEICFEYFWLLIFLNQASLQFDNALLLIEEAKNILPLLLKDKKDLLHLKMAEILYQCSKFQDSYKVFSSLLKTNSETFPDIGYWYTKYLQICLITKNFDTAKWILDYKRKSRGEHFEKLISIRDIISFAKYYLLVGEYEEAFYFIRLGFTKNPKAKYFQYEIELRNLEAAYFYLSGNTQQALSFCKRNIIWLAHKGYNIKTSIYPKFFVVTKAIYNQNTLGKKIPKSAKSYWEELQLSNAAVYGILLNKINEIPLKNSKPN